MVSSGSCSTSESVFITLRVLLPFSWNFLYVQQKTFTLFCKLQSRDYFDFITKQQFLLFENFKFGGDL